LYELDDSDKYHFCRYLARKDLFFLLWFVLNRKDMAHPWLLERCREVEAEPDNCLDLWARGHYKSTIITFAKTIQDIVDSHGDDPNPKWLGKYPSFGIFSHTRPIAKAFLSQIKREAEANTLLRELYPDVFWTNCHRESPKWSEDDGLIFKRKSNQKESTVEAWGLVDSQPTSKHFDVLIYDDVVTQESVRSPLMQEKVLESFQMSLNLGSQTSRKRMIGTRYHFNDLYKNIIDNNICQVRKHAVTKNGEADGEPVLFDKDKVLQKRRDMGIYIFSTQMLLNPVKDSMKGFRRDWLLFHNLKDESGLNIYIIVDPANDKKKKSDFTSMIVVGLSVDQNYYVIDIVRDRLSLTERGDMLFKLHYKYKPIAVGYERYGMQTDTSYLRDRMEREKYHFNLIELFDGLSKTDRIEKLVPIFENGRILLPNQLMKQQSSGKIEDVIQTFLIDEYDAYPVASHDDCLDALSRVQDEKLNAFFPSINPVDYKVFLPQATSFWAQ